MVSGVAVGRWPAQSRWAADPRRRGLPADRRTPRWPDGWRSPRWPDGHRSRGGPLVPDVTDCLLVAGHRTGGGLLVGAGHGLRAGRRGSRIADRTPQVTIAGRMPGPPPAHPSCWAVKTILASHKSDARPLCWGIAGMSVGRGTTLT